jgi:acetyl esterase/lipase
LRPLLFAAALALAAPAHADPLSLRDYIASMKPAAADETVRYGPEAAQVVDVYRPSTPGPHPAVILVHGGCWKRQVGRETLSNVARALTARGVAVWNVEYRRVDEPGGGYPGTYQDVAAAVDRLRAEAPRLSVDLSRTIAVGHSSGAHLALWAASRHRLPAASLLRTAEPLPIPTVVSLGGVGDLKGLADLVPWACGPDPKLSQVVGEKTDARPDPFADTSPRQLLPTGVRTVFLQGEYDDILPPFVAYFWRRAAERAGDPVAVRTLVGAGHFDVVAPHTPTWSAVQAAIEAELQALSAKPR